MSYDCPYKMRAWDGRKMVTVQSLCFNQGGALWYGQGNQFGWAWVNEKFDGWTNDNPKPSKADVCPVMRWTELKDKNGTEIWEGDIVRILYWSHTHHGNIGTENIGYIEYNKAYAIYYCVARCSDGSKGYIELYNRPGSARTTEARFEIIGNIHQNPELLK